MKMAGPGESDAIRPVARSLASRLRMAMRRAIGAGSRADTEQVLHRLTQLESLLVQTLHLNRKILKVLERQRVALLDIVGERGLQGETRQANVALQAILRRLAVDPAALDYPHALRAQRFRVLSQNEEDGILWALFQRVGVTNRRFVEIGCGVNGGNSGFLAQDCGWTGLMVDASPVRIAHIRERFGSDVVAVAAHVTRETIDDLLARHGLTGEIDLFSLDIDSCDYWVWEALSVCSPRVVVVEYNAAFGFDRAVTVPHAPDFDRRLHGHRRYYGGSLRAFIQLGARKGYRLVVNEPRGVNAFFLRNDVGPGVPAWDPAPDPDRAADAAALFEEFVQHGLPLVEVPAGTPR